MAVVENASNQDSAEQNHVRSRTDRSLPEDDQRLYNKIGGPHPQTNGGDLRRSDGGGGGGGSGNDELGDSFKRDTRELQELFSKLNPMAAEFVPHSLVNNGLNGRFHTNQVAFQNNNGNGAGKRKKISGQGKRKLNIKTSIAQREEIIRRTVYVSDIDHQVAEEQLAGLFVSYGQKVRKLH